MATRMTVRSVLQALFAALLGGVISIHAVRGADSYPSRPIHLIVPWPAGGSGDTYARPIAQRLAARIGQSVIVENRGGAAGAVGVTAAAQAAPDGYTIVMGSVNDMGVGPALKPDLPYDVLRDFVPITQLLSAPYVVIANPGVGISTLKDIAAMARAKPGSVSFASSGSGGNAQIAGAMLARALDVQLLEVPYKGGAPAMTAVVSGEANIGFQYPNVVVPMFEAGRVRALAIMGPRRVAALPGVPTTSEAGFPSLLVDGWIGFLVPARTPVPIVQRLHDELIQVLKSPDLVHYYAKTGVHPVGSSPAEFAAFIKAEQAKWVKVIADAGVKGE